jgi:hypothetical protein
MGGNLRILYTKSVIVFSIYHKVKVRAQLEKVPWLGFM